MLTPRNLPRRAARFAAACTLLAVTLAGAQAPRKDIIRPEDPTEGKAGQPRGIEVIPPAPGAAKAPVPRARRIEVKGPDGKLTYVYKCGSEFTDSPVCTAPVKPSTMKPTEAELARCKRLTTKDGMPWYCR